MASGIGETEVFDIALWANTAWRCCVPERSLFGLLASSVGSNNARLCPVNDIIGQKRNFDVGAGQDRVAFRANKMGNISQWRICSYRLFAKDGFVSNGSPSAL